MSGAIEPVTDSALITNDQNGEVSWDATIDVQAASVKKLIYRELRADTHNAFCVTL